MEAGPRHGRAEPRHGRRVKFDKYVDFLTGTMDEKAFKLRSMRVQMESIPQDSTEYKTYAAVLKAKKSLVGKIENSDEYKNSVGEYIPEISVNDTFKPVFSFAGDPFASFAPAFIDPFMVKPPTFIDPFMAKPPAFIDSLLASPPAFIGKFATLSGTKAEYNAEIKAGAAAIIEEAQRIERNAQENAGRSRVSRWFLGDTALVPESETASRTWSVRGMLSGTVTSIKSFGASQVVGFAGTMAAAAILPAGTGFIVGAFVSTTVTTIILSAPDIYRGWKDGTEGIEIGKKIAVKFVASMAGQIIGHYAGASFVGTLLSTGGNQATAYISGYALNIQTAPDVVAVAVPPPTAESINLALEARLARQHQEQFAAEHLWRNRIKIVSLYAIGLVSALCLVPLSAGIAGVMVGAGFTAGVTALVGGLGAIAGLAGTLIGYFWPLFTGLIATTVASYGHTLSATIFTQSGVAQSMIQVVQQQVTGALERGEQGENIIGRTLRYKIWNVTVATVLASTSQLVLTAALQHATKLGMQSASPHLATVLGGINTMRVNVVERVTDVLSRAGPGTVDPGELLGGILREEVKIENEGQNVFTQRQAQEMEHTFAPTSDVTDAPDEYKWGAPPEVTERQHQEMDNVFRPTSDELDAPAPEQKSSGIPTWFFREGDSEVLASRKMNAANDQLTAKLDEIGIAYDSAKLGELLTEEHVHEAIGRLEKFQKTYRYKAAKAVPKSHGLVQNTVRLAVVLNPAGAVGATFAAGAAVLTALDTVETAASVSEVVLDAYGHTEAANVAGMAGGGIDAINPSEHVDGFLDGWMGEVDNMEVAFDMFMGGVQEEAAGGYAMWGATKAYFKSDAMTGFGRSDNSGYNPWAGRPTE